jgi:hypothetical protein
MIYAGRGKNRKKVSERRGESFERLLLSKNSIQLSTQCGCDPFLEMKAEVCWSEEVEESIKANINL